MVLTVLAPNAAAGKVPADKAETIQVEYVLLYSPHLPLSIGKTDFTPSSSIVAVHGLNGDPVNTWTHPTTKAFWLNKYYDVPHGVSPLFTGREELSQRLQDACFPVESHENVKQEKIFVVHGLGGSGKTQLCLKFAQDNREKFVQQILVCHHSILMITSTRFWGVFWIDASSYDTAEQSFLSVARALGLAQNYEATKRWLSTAPEKWLLVIDNADDPRLDVSQYFPVSERGIILVTSRNLDCGIQATIGDLDVGSMNVEESTTLLLKAAKAKDTSDSDARQSARSVVETLKYLALAVVQAGAAIRHGLVPMQEYCSTYNHNRKRLLNYKSFQGSEQYKRTVYTTWEVSIDIIEKMATEASHDALELLQILSFLHFERIPEAIFKNAWKNHPDKDLSESEKATLPGLVRQNGGEDCWDPWAFREAINLLTSFSLVTVEEVNSDKCISMHPLVHTWAKDRMTEAGQEQSWRTTTVLIGASLVRPPIKTEDYLYQRFLLPHVDSCLFSREDDLFSMDHHTCPITLVLTFAGMCSECGHLGKAMVLREKILGWCKNALGVEHHMTLKAMNDLSLSYLEMDRVQETVALAREVLEIELPVSVDDPSLLSYIFGLWDKGLRSDKDLTRTRKEACGKEHLNMLESMYILGKGHHGLGQHLHAIEKLELVSEGSERTLGKDHHLTLKSKRALACLYRESGSNHRAVTVLRSILDATVRTMGEDHPLTLDALHHLAQTYSKMDRSVEAADIQERIVRLSKKIFGECHPDTINYKSWLAEFYHRSGRHQDAVKLQEALVSDSRRLTIEEDPEVLLCRMDLLANYYSDAGQAEDAVRTQMTLYDMCKKTYGEKHSKTLMSMGCLANYHSKAGRLENACTLQWTVLDSRIAWFGEKNADTIRDMVNLAFYHYKIGNVMSAVYFAERAAELSKTVLGEMHPQTLQNSDWAKFYRVDFQTKEKQTAGSLLSFEWLTSAAVDPTPVATDAVSNDTFTSGEPVVIRRRRRLFELASQDTAGAVGHGL